MIQIVFIEVMTALYIFLIVVFYISVRPNDKVKKKVDIKFSASGTLKAKTFFYNMFIGKIILND